MEASAGGGGGIGGDAYFDLSQYDLPNHGFRDVWKDEYFRHRESGNTLAADLSHRAFSRDEVSDDGDPELERWYLGTPFEVVNGAPVDPA